MTQETLSSLEFIQKKLSLKSLVKFNKNIEVVAKIGDPDISDALIKSNFIPVLESDIAMPIRLPNNEIYEMVMKNQRGIVAKEGRINRYLVGLRMDFDSIIVAIGDNLDPGMILFELMSYYNKLKS